MKKIEYKVFGVTFYFEVHDSLWFYGDKTTRELESDDRVYENLSNLKFAFEEMQKIYKKLYRYECNSFCDKKFIIKSGVGTTWKLSGFQSCYFRIYRKKFIFRKNILLSEIGDDHYTWRGFNGVGDFIFKDKYIPHMTELATSLKYYTNSIKDKLKYKEDKKKAFGDLLSI